MGTSIRVRGQGGRAWSGQLRRRAWPAVLSGAERGSRAGGSACGARAAQASGARAAAMGAARRRSRTACASWGSGRTTAGCRWGARAGSQACPYRGGCTRRAAPCPLTRPARPVRPPLPGPSGPGHLPRVRPRAAARGGGRGDAAPHRGEPLQPPPPPTHPLHCGAGLPGLGRCAHSWLARRLGRCAPPPVTRVLRVCARRRVTHWATGA
jgi:hypothetical protein